VCGLSLPFERMYSVVYHNVQRSTGLIDEAGLVGGTTRGDIAGFDRQSGARSWLIWAAPPLARRVLALGLETLLPNMDFTGSPHPSGRAYAC
jgi:hypothetical protein